MSAVYALTKKDNQIMEYMIHYILHLFKAGYQVVLLYDTDQYAFKVYSKVLLDAKDFFVEPEGDCFTLYYQNSVTPTFLEGTKNYGAGKVTGNLSVISTNYPPSKKKIPIFSFDPYTRVVTTRNSNGKKVKRPNAYFDNPHTYSGLLYVSDIIGVHLAELYMLVDSK